MGIRVNGVAPGFVYSRRMEARVKGGDTSRDWMLDRVPMGRFADPSEIASVVDFLTGPGASYMTGETRGPDPVP